MDRDKPTVTFAFEGIMLFRFREREPFGEIGVLPSPDHRFRIKITECYGDLCETRCVPLPADIPPGEIWRLDIPPQALIINHDNPPIDRSDDNIEGPLAFEWIVDLEGLDFHQGKVDCHENVLAPVIRVPGGFLYTLQLTEGPFDVRRPGVGRREPYGFVSEVIGLDVCVPDTSYFGMSSLLGNCIFKWQKETGKTYVVHVLNTPDEVHSYIVGMPDASHPHEHTHPGPSHLQLYYLHLNESGERRFELVPSPHIAPPPFFCGGVGAGQTTDPLRRR